MSAGNLIRTILLLAAVTTVVTACGRRPATLDTPYDAAVEARREAQRNNEPMPPEPTRPEPDRKFILDPLI